MFYVIYNGLLQEPQTSIGAARAFIARTARAEGVTPDQFDVFRFVHTSHGFCRSHRIETASDYHPDRNPGGFLLNPLTPIRSGIKCSIMGKTEKRQKGEASGG